MMPRNAFNIVDWSLRKASGEMVLRPRWTHALGRFVFGTGVFALFTFGTLGLDYEISRMREARRFTETEIAALRGEEGGRGGNVKARDPVIEEAISKREAEITAGEAADLKWHLLLRGLAGIWIFFGVYLPLSPLWQRVRIAREGEMLVVRKNIFPRTRRVGIGAVAHAELSPIGQQSTDGGVTYTISTYWNLRLNDGTRSIELYLGMAPGNDVSTLTPRVHGFLGELQKLVE